MKDPTQQSLGPNQRSKIKLGMWSWKDSDFSSAKARKELFTFCDREGISHIDQHIKIEKGCIQNAESLEHLIAEAAKQQISVNALCGEKTMFLERNHARSMAKTQAIIRFNNTLPRGLSLAGLKFDVELYLNEEWKASEERRQQIIQDYLRFLTEVKAYLKQEAPQMELAVDIPFWWNSPDYQIEFDQRIKPLSHHILDLVDWVGIMSYRQHADRIMQLIQPEIDYAKAQGYHKAVAPGIETSAVSSEEAHISFHNLPPHRFRSALTALQDEVADKPQIRCIMLHHYGSLRSYLSQP